MRFKLHYTNTATHHVSQVLSGHDAVLGFFHAKGYYFDVTAFGIVVRVWAIPEWR